MNVPISEFETEKLGETAGQCACCGRTSRRVWGRVDGRDGTVAVYFVTWTADHLAENGANIDLIVGSWGDETSSTDRVAVSLIHREGEGGAEVMVVDVDAQQFDHAALAQSGLRRDEVIGTPLAAQIFAIVDAICLQDDRLFA